MSSPPTLPQLIAAQDWPAAERMLRRMAAQKGAPASVFYNLAKVLDQMGQGAKMLPWLRRAVATDPQYQHAWFELGRALMRDDPAQAAAAFARAAALDPADQDCWRNLARLRLRLGDWAGCAAALAHLPADGETAILSYRLACETGNATAQQRSALLADKALRPAALKALTRVAKGSLPLRLP